MSKKRLTAGLATFLAATATWADNPTNSRDITQTITLSSALNASCFAESAAKAFRWDEPDWWEALGYASPEAWFADALSEAVAGLRFESQFNVKRLNGTERRRGRTGTVNHVDFSANLAAVTLAIAITDTPDTASSLTGPWQEHGFSWISEEATAESRGVGGTLGDSRNGSGTESTATLAVFVNGTNIEEFFSKLTFNARSWSVATSGVNPYSSVLTQAALVHGWKISPAFAEAAANAFALAVAQARAFVDMEVHYQKEQGKAAIDKSTVTLECGSDSFATTRAYTLE